MGKSLWWVTTGGGKYIYRDIKCKETMPFDPSWTNLLSKSLQFLKHEKSLNKFTITIRKSKTPLLPDSYSREGKFVETLRKMSRRKHHRGLMESVSER